MDNRFGGVIWTNHALGRMRQRGISQSDAWATWSRPDQSRYATARGAWIYYKTYGREKIEVVAKKNERGEWIILSVWSRPVYGKEAKAEPFLKFIFKKIFGA
jgi:hypothetical protein